MEDKSTEETFEYMLHHDLLDGDRIKHFSVHQMYRRDDYYTSCSLDGVQPVLIAWMKQEGERLRQREHWVVARSNKIFGSGHLVLEYDTLFHYQSSKYRLRLDDWCVDYYCCCEIDRGDCIDCDKERDNEDVDDKQEEEVQTVHFELIKESVKETPRVNKKESQVHQAQQTPHMLSDEFKAIPCEPVLEWDIEL